MDSSRIRQLGVVAPVVGVGLTLVAFATVVLGVVDPFADIPSAEYLGEIDGRPTLWLVAHLLVAVAVVLKLTGLLTLSAVAVSRGRAGWAVVGGAVAALGAVLLVVTMVRDGYVHEFMAQQWAAAPAAEQAFWEDTFAASLRTSYGTELASMLLLLSFAPVAFGMSIRESGVLSSKVAWVGFVQGAGALLTALVLWVGGPSDLGYGALYPVFGVLLPSVWTVWVAVGLHRVATGREGAAVARPEPALGLSA